MNIAPNLPQIFHKAERALSVTLPENVRSSVYSSPDRCRAMRSDRDASIRAVLSVLARRTDLASCRAVNIKGETATPVTVLQLSRETGLAERTVAYVLAFLTEHGFITSEKQLRGRVQYTSGGAGLVVTAIYRSITPKLWAFLGLLAEFKAAVVEAMNRGLRLKYIRPGLEVKTAGPLKGVRRPIPPDAPPPPPEKRPDPKTDVSRDSIMESVRRAWEAQRRMLNAQN